MKIYKQNHKGQATLLIIAQDEQDAAYLNQLIGAQLLSLDESVNGQRRIRVMSDLDSMRKPKPKDKFKDRTHDDLLDMAARRDLSVPRNILRDDLEAILLAHEDDPDEAKELIELARPAPEKQQFRKQKAETGVGGMGRAGFETYNGGDL